MTAVPIPRAAGALALGGLVALAACDEVNLDYNRQAIDVATRLVAIDALPPTETANLPSGTATYTGVAAFSYDAPLQTGGTTNFDLLSDISITADFQTNGISGSLSNFNAPDSAMSGTIDLTNGALAGNVLEADAIGTISDGTTDVDLDLTLLGGFRGEDGTAIFGAAAGTYATSDGQDGTVFGGFGAETN